MRMAGFLKKMSLVPAGLRYKLTIAFVLMSVVPLIICVYLTTNYIFPVLTSIWDVSVIIGIAIFIALLGFKIVKDIVFPIVDMAVEAKAISNGDLTHHVTVESEDEIGKLGNTLNFLTRRIRENMDDLRTYGERNKEISIEVSKKVLVLSGLLQIGNQISQGALLEQTLHLIVDKVSYMIENSSVFLMLFEDGGNLVMNVNYHLKPELKSLKFKAKEGLMGKTALEAKTVVFDKRSKTSEDFDEFVNLFSLKNFVLVPVVIRAKSIGVLCMGNIYPEYEFKEEDIELLKLFGKQIALAAENDLLARKTQQLSIKDELTGLYNEKFIISRLDEEIKRAVRYQRPCSFLIFSVDDLEIYRKSKGDLITEETIKKIGKVIESNVTEIDRVGRINSGEFAVVMPEKNKKQANSLAEVLRQRIEAFSIAGGGDYPRRFVTVSGGVSENPLDGATSDQLIKKAGALLEEARSRGKNVVVS